MLQLVLLLLLSGQAEAQAITAPPPSMGEIPHLVPLLPTEAARERTQTRDLGTVATEGPAAALLRFLPSSGQELLVKATMAAQVREVLVLPVAAVAAVPPRREPTSTQGLLLLETGGTGLRTLLLGLRLFTQAEAEAVETIEAVRLLLGQVVPVAGETVG